MLTQHNNSQRTGANLAETMLTPTTVASRNFRELTRYFVEGQGQVYAQPLYASAVDIKGSGRRNVLIIATAKNWLYAFDADAPSGSTPAPLWKFDAGSTITAPGKTIYSGPGIDINPSIGIIGTPVIDLENFTVYFVAMTQPDPKRKDFAHILHAVDIRTGLSRASMVIVGETQGGGSFNSAKENQRAALGLAKDRVFIAWASFGDLEPYDGLVTSYGTVDSKNGLKKLTQFQVNSHDPLLGHRPKGGGIWHSGGGPAIDSSNEFLYVVTGNGKDTSDHAGEQLDSSDVKLDMNLRVQDYYTPSYREFLNDNDLDLSVSGPMIPDEWKDKNGNSVRRLLHGSKAGILYNINRDGMGRFHQHESDSLVQSITVFHEPNNSAAMDKNHIHTTPAYWVSHQDRTVYVASDWGLGIRGFVFHDDGILDSKPALSTLPDPHLYAIGQLSISANGTKDGIIWAIGCVQCVDPQLAATNSGGKQGVLLAYRADTLGAPIFTSDLIGLYPRFNAPTVANGRVYVPTFDKGIIVFGFRPHVDNSAVTQYLLDREVPRSTRRSIAPVLNIQLNNP